MQKAVDNRLLSVEVTDDTVRGSISRQNDGILFLSIPYNEWWTAEVNGKKVELLRANTGFSAIALSAGESEIYMKYTSPYFGLSIAVSVFGCAAFVALCLYNRKQKKKIEVEEKDA